MQALFYCLLIAGDSWGVASKCLFSKRSINHVRQDKVCCQEAGAGEQFHGSSAS